MTSPATQATVYDMQGTERRPGTDLGLTTVEFNNIVAETQRQPDWRAQADKCVDYYDNNQIDDETMVELQRRGLAPIIDNLIQPTIDVVLGLEAKTRTDWRLAADDEKHQDIAEALSVKLHEAERMTDADGACSDAYAGQVKAGIGWVEVARNADPFKYKYRAKSIHRRQMFWDWSAEDPLLDDAGYLIRRKWFPLAKVVAFFPEHKDLILSAGSGWPNDITLRFASEHANLFQAFDQEARTTIEQWDWRDLALQRVCLYEVIYRRYVRGHVIRLRNDRVLEFDQNNPFQVEAVNRGLATLQGAVYSRLHRTIYMGPHKLQADRPLKSRTLPYIPFWGYREDLTGVPYGLIRTMLSPQDEINARAQKLMWSISAKRLMLDSDALDTKFNSISDAIFELSRPDAVIVKNPNRQNKDANAITVDDNITMSNQQMQVLNDRRQTLQMVRGVFNAMLGRGDEVKSGIAINSLVEQGMTVLAEINDNYRTGRRAVGNKLFEAVREDHMGREVAIVAGEGSTKRTIVLNQQTVDPATGMEDVVNDVATAEISCALEDVPSTPSYRAQQLVMLTEAMKSLPPDIQLILAPFYIELTDLPDRKKIGQLIRKQFGLPDDPEAGSDPRVQALEAQYQEQMALLQQQLDDALAQLDQATARLQDKADAAALTRRTTLEKAELDNATKLTIAAMGHQDQERAREAKAEESKQAGKTPTTTTRRPASKKKPGAK